MDTKLIIIVRWYLKTIRGGGILILGLIRDGEGERV